MLKRGRQTMLEAHIKNTSFMDIQNMGKLITRAGELNIRLQKGKSLIRKDINPTKNILMLWNEYYDFKLCIDDFENYFIKHNFTNDSYTVGKTTTLKELETWAENICVGYDRDDDKIKY